MPIVFEGKVFPAGGSVRVTIPAAIARTLELKPGDKVLMSLNDHQMTLEKASRKAKS
jgi:AbrB family looped-hinge helix DNA binding protein